MSSLLDTGGIIAEVAKLHTLLTEVEVQEHVLKNIPVKAGTEGSSFLRYK